ncbi:dimethylaniline monooxygenase [Zopfia rhizophila CBS 207.26]|uniref:Dimethylaniline monooxygenase n=1 Tax=Zopfia rhizophila CBS 207.26 TaxID=1314779 RepID=A0A6A6E9U6_9PEZI|nr:dimethylaniline monooxygenase [Zopfia rhizophila CBS 207.26]
MRVAVIGGGPSGLVTLKYLLEAHKFFPVEPIEARLFEATDAIGGTFQQRTYEDAEMVSSKQLTTFSDFRIKDPAAPDFLITKDYVEYLEDYCDHFQLRACISLSTRVLEVGRQYKGSGHEIRFQKEEGNVEIWSCDAVAVCSGLHVDPNIPHVPGIENVPSLMHSSRFKGREQFGIDKTVMILGAGETGMDVAHLAVTGQTRHVILCHKNGFFCAPKRVPDPVLFGQVIPNKPLNIPVDVSSASLFDTMYAHPVLRDGPMLWTYYDCFSSGMDQWIGGIPKEKFHVSKIFFNKSNKAMPYISAPWRKYNWIQKLRSRIMQLPLLDTGDRHIDLAPWPEKFDDNGVVHFMDSGRAEAQKMRKLIIKPDVVILATGYKQNFPFLAPDYPQPENANVRRIWQSGDETVGFIGFVRPSLGAIPPLSEFQAQLWIQALLHQIPHPLTQETHYRLLTDSDRRIQYGVDHEAYAYQLALDCGSATSFINVLSYGWKVATVWALGANFNVKFRLTGPWRLDGAAEVMKEELWPTITRRGGFFGM